MLQSFNTGGFAMTFENGLKIAVMFGPGTESSNKHKQPRFPPTHSTKANAAQILISDERNGRREYYTFPLDGNTLQGYVNADGVAEWIKAVQKATSLKDIVEPENV